MRAILAVLAAVVVSGCCTSNVAQAPRLAVPSITTTARTQPSSIDTFITEIEGIFDMRITDRTGLITAAFDVCKQIRKIEDPVLYADAIRVFGEGAMLPDHQATLAVDSIQRFACPDQYERTRKYVE